MFALKKSKNHKKRNWQPLILDVLENIGGRENVNNLFHCQTRLRFNLNDINKVNIDNIKKVEGVINVVISGGQCQIIVGPHVKEVCDEFNKCLNKVQSGSEKNETKTKQSVFGKLIDFVSGTFSPIIPAIAGAGMVKALLAVLLVCGLIQKESQSYYIINMMSDAVFYFLPVLLASSAATKLKCNPVIAVVLAAILLHPNFIVLKNTAEGVEIFGLPIRLVTYSSSVVPILLIVWLQSYVEKLLNYLIHDSIKIIFVPMFTIFITSIVGLTLLGPLGAIVGDFLAVGFETMQQFGGWTIVLFIAIFWPILVTFGIHHSISPLAIAQLTTLGIENIVGPGAMLANITQGTAALIVSMRAEDKGTKTIAKAGGITALMGITEPALYGVNLPKKYPLIAGMIGASAGGLYAGLTEVHRYAVGASGIPAIPLYLGDNIWNLYNIIIAILISVPITAILTYLFSLKYESKDVIESKNSDVNFIKDVATKIDYKNPIAGNVLNLEDIKDPVFSSKTLGDGYGIEPSEGEVFAPFDCTVISLFPTKHAICLESDDGVELLIHVGIDTVNLNGKYFKSQVEQGQKVKSGQLLLTFDMAEIKNSGYSLQTPVIFTNYDEKGIGDLSKKILSGTYLSKQSPLEIL
ncbi:PTS beta-glucoside transporter subunit EIIBCA [Klebsiella oxytoca]|uniref:beta-glucoside-specific PTS transporter subunit IIABC n=1 Tax=Klebsiella oxytoca TaxID=571 RepID=UPI0010918AF5|nr:beta-glucoside-specific PTS transporter subunit IIABC [Klebsiella oxytoca]TGN40789.1 PTS beta-glucoside transporter subunit EIIBCA [Klebsiella oxytoca]